MGVEKKKKTTRSQSTPRYLLEDGRNVQLKIHDGRVSSELRPLRSKNRRSRPIVFLPRRSLKKKKQQQ